MSNQEANANRIPPSLDNNPAAKDLASALKAEGLEFEDITSVVKRTPAYLRGLIDQARALEEGDQQNRLGALRVHFNTLITKIKASGILFDLENPKDTPVFPIDLSSDDLQALKNEDSDCFIEIVKPRGPNPGLDDFVSFGLKDKLASITTTNGDRYDAQLSPDGVLKLTLAMTE